MDESMGDYNRKGTSRVQFIKYIGNIYVKSLKLKNTFKLIHNQSRTKCRCIYTYISKLNYLTEVTVITSQLIHSQKSRHCWMRCKNTVCELLSR